MTLALTLPIILVVIANYPRGSLSSLLSRSNRLCDPEYCDSLVNKCTITQRCVCNFGIGGTPRDWSCAKDCVDCLEEKFGKCCGCIDGLCNTPRDDYLPSHVGTFSKSSVDSQLFQVLTEEEDIHGRWKVDKIENFLSFSHPDGQQFKLAEGVNKVPELTFVSDDSKAVEPPKDCVVAFINRDLSLMKCKKSCTTMGASFFRWFHHGCCECVGPNCINYGIAEPNCSFEHD